jgi:chromosome segregation ATPase
MQAKSRSLLQPLLWLVFSWVFLFQGYPSAAEQQTGPELGTWPPSTMQLLPTVIDTNARMKILLPRLAERNQEIKSLKGIIEQLKEQLEQQGKTSSEDYEKVLEQLRLAEISRDELKKEVTEISNSHQRLQQDYSAQKTSSDNYRKEADLQIKDIKRERNGWRVAGIGGILAAIAAFLYAIFK